MLGKVFTFLPFGDIAYRVNLMSAVFAAATSVLILKIAVMQTGRLLPSLAAALAFSFSYYVWTLSVVAEVYTLNAFATALIIFLWLRWEEGRNKRLLYGAALIWGLSLGGHLTIGLLGLAFAYLGIRELVKKNIIIRDVLLMAGVFLFGAVLVYSYLPWRYLADAYPNVVGTFDATGQFNALNLASLSGLWWMISSREFDQLYFAYDVPGFFRELGVYLKALHANFLAIGLVLGVVGIVRSVITKPHQFVLLFLVFISNMIFFVNYGAFDKATMFLPTYVVWALWMAEGIAYITGTLASYTLVGGTPYIRRLGQAVARVPWEKAALLLPVAALVVNFSYADASSGGELKEEYQSFLASVETDAVIAAWYLDLWPMVYLQTVENVRPDVTIVDRFRISREEESELMELALTGRPVYVFGWVPYMNFPHRAVPVWKSKQDVALGWHDVAQRIESLPASAP